MLPETRTRWDNDLSNGEVQYLINKGFTIGELAVMYEIPRNWIKDAVMHGDIKFKQKTGHKAPEKPVTAMWSDAKKLALSGSWTSPQEKEDKAMKQDDLFESMDTADTSVYVNPYGKIEPTKNPQTCPCCNQMVKLYKRSIPAVVAHDLIVLSKAVNNDEYKHITTFQSKGGGGDFARLETWGLIQAKPNDSTHRRTSGLWTITQKGRDFVDRKLMVRKYVQIYNNTFYGYDGGMVTIDDCLGEHFDYSELMSR